MRTAILTFLVVLVAGVPSAVTHAWTPAVRVHMVEEALRLMPESLRLAMTSYQDDLRRGVLEPMVGEDGPEHRPPWDDGRLQQSLETEVSALIVALQAGRDFNDISRRFGRVAHFVVDAGFPPAMEPDSGNRYAHFSEFCEDRMSKFPLVFYGHDEEDGQPIAYDRRALEIMTRAREDDRLLARAYAAAGEPPNPAHFDDRSVPFAVASLAYSHGVTDVVRIWLAAWREAGGDMGRTPYLGIDQELKKN